MSFLSNFYSEVSAELFGLLMTPEKILLRKSACWIKYWEQLMATAKSTSSCWSESLE